jgi:hypothetical protein
VGVCVVWMDGRMRWAGEPPPTIDPPLPPPKKANANPSAPSNHTTTNLPPLQPSSTCTPHKPLEALVFALRAVGLDLARRALLRHAAPQALHNTARIMKRALGLEHEVSLEELRADAERCVWVCSCVRVLYGGRVCWVVGA